MTDREQNNQQDRPASTMLTAGEVARILNVHVSTVRRWSEQGKIKSYRVGPRGERRFRREDVAVFYLDRAIQELLKGQPE
jgi:excisionase family DNA binding protein